MNWYTTLIVVCLVYYILYLLFRTAGNTLIIVTILWFFDCLSIVMVSCQLRIHFSQNNDK